MPVRTVVAEQPDGTDGPAAEQDPPEPSPAKAEPPVPPDALRILVIGESSAQGEPYHPWLSVGQIAAWKLESVLPGRPIHVDMWAYGGRDDPAHAPEAGRT